MTTTMNAWLLRAMHDLERAALELRTGQKTEALLSCHRAIERVLKGIIVARGDPPPADSHDLAALAGGQASGGIPARYRELAARLQGVKDSFDSPLTTWTPDKGLTTEDLAGFLEEAGDFLLWALGDTEGR